VEATPISKSDAKGVKGLSQVASKKSFRSKLSTVSRANRSRRAGSTIISGAPAPKTGTISVAMQILNMDEDEKE
jgi:hypothetical protein